MIVSEAKINANRRNARLSTGPKTADGKERSRANALKHGLCSIVVVAEDPEHITTRSRELFFALKPQNAHHLWLVDEAAVVSLRIDRIERQERRIRDKRSLRAELFWDDDRKLEAIRLGATIRSNPDEVVEALKRTPQGCEWLMARWAMLAHAADLKTTWTPAQKRLAFDLLATPEEFRDGFEPGASLDFDGQVSEGSTDFAAIARREIAALKERRDAVEGFDEALQSIAVADLANDEEDPELKKLRRYETTLHSRFRWCVKQINTPSPYKHAASHLDPAPIISQTLPPEPSEKPAEPPIAPLTLKDHPPFDLEPDEYPEPGQVADIPAILAKRAEKKRVKAENRRDQRRRSIDKLREAS
jgi:hypothetical protein